MSTVSQMDELFYRMARAHIDRFVLTHVSSLLTLRTVLEIGPRVRERGATSSLRFDTLDIAPGCTYQADITQRTPIEDSTYDVVLCMEVLEHTTDPFAGLREIRRILKPGGLLLASAPMNFREHGPLPDCWRFTRHGWRVMLKDWDSVDLDVLMTPDRFLMPLHICASARCNKDKNVDARTMTFPLETT